MITLILITLIVIAIIMVFIGLIMLFLGSLRSSESKIEGGGVIIIGPLPIVIGTSEKISKMLIILAIILTIVSIIMFLLLTRAVILFR
jgi:uncharacterized protein (TIGR00304 family)